MNHTPGPANVTAIAGIDYNTTARVDGDLSKLLYHANWVCRLFGTDNPQGIAELKEHVRQLREAIAKATA